MHSSSDKHRVKVIAVTGGKGGVGKSNVAVNLSIALARQGQRVVVLDADLGLANLDVILGLKPARTLEDVFSGECSLEQVMLEGPQGIRIIPASSGTQSMVKLSQQEHAGLVQAFSEIAGQMDVLIVDTAAGISDSVVNFVRAAQEVLVVVCDEPSSITDAYALIKLLSRQYGIHRFRVVANQTRKAKEGRMLFERLLHTTDKFLDVSLMYEGDVPYDDALRAAIKRQRAVMDTEPDSKAGKAFIKLADKVNVWPIPEAASGHLEFFVERLVMQQAG